ncbi:hypothetical protein Rsub_11744 [Raphidocelis subcapitata]|uniref:Fibrous sheath-interacting protein 1 n=1 Tax=Raphidocelis subcapitata TaxID=307507 RepID=A0A2V0PJZ2_9CHLO|nr:hypothetical protein Rsub_11744 [Raphidocelis subcapitata]|eukprot:GBF99332.1 hypothetical protein Rsub_11744 [Raphidocelis subcapitata]
MEQRVRRRATSAAGAVPARSSLESLPPSPDAAMQESSPRPASAGARAGAAPPRAAARPGDSLARRSLLAAPPLAGTDSCGDRGSPEPFEPHSSCSDSCQWGLDSRAHEGDTFLTALRRRCSAEPPLRASDGAASDGSASGNAPSPSPGLRSLSSSANLVLTPGCPSFAGGAAAGAARRPSSGGLDGECSESGAPSDTTTNPMLTPEDSSGGPHGALEATESLLQVIASVYSPGDDIVQLWGGDFGGRRAGGTARERRAPRRPRLEAPESSFGAAVELPADPSCAAEASAAASEAHPAPAEGQQVPGRPDSPEGERNAGTGGGGELHRAAVGCLVARAEARAALSAELGGCVDALLDAARAGADGWAEGEGGGGGGGSGGGDDAGSPGDQNSGDGGRPLTATRRSLLLDAARRLLREARFAGGWAGPRAFEQLPVGQLPPAGANESDPRVAEGLARVRALDARLRETTLAALIAAREADPVAAAEAEHARIERRGAQLDALLAAERRKREHAARLVRALHGLDAAAGAQHPNTYYRLSSEEEALLRCVLRRDDGALEADNPFDLCCPPAAGGGAGCAAGGGFVGSAAQHGAGSGGGGGGGDCSGLGIGPEEADGAATDRTASKQVGAPRPSSERCDSREGSGHGGEGGGGEGGGGGGGQSVRARLAEIDARLREFAASHEWDAGGSLADFRGVLPRASTAASEAGPPMATVPPPSSRASAPACGSCSGCGSGGASFSAPVQQGGTPAGGSRRARSERDGAAAPPPAPAVVAAAVAAVDYLRAAREARELESRERELDAQLRALRAVDESRSVIPLTRRQLDALLAACVRQQAGEVEAGGVGPVSGAAAAAAGAAVRVAG